MGKKAETHYPRIENWELIFVDEDKKEKFKEELAKFGKYSQATSLKLFKFVPMVLRVRIKGIFYENEDQKRNEHDCSIVTSNLLGVEKVSNAFFKINTQSGSVYYLKRKAISEAMKNALKTGDVDKLYTEFPAVDK